MQDMRDFMMERMSHFVACVFIVGATIVLSFAFHAAGIPSPPQSTAQVIQNCISSTESKYANGALRTDDHVSIASTCANAVVAGLRP
jgi:hypothetical protein